MRLPKLSFEPLAIAFAALAVLLLVIFLVLLGATQPRSSGAELPYTTVQRMAAAGQIRHATQLDYDNRLLITDRTGREGWTSYPANGALEDQLLTQLSAKGASVVIDAQSGKQARRLIVQVLLPILILAALFALFMRLSQQSDAGGMGAFSRWRGKRSKLGPDPRGRTVLRATSPARAARSPSCRSCAICCAHPSATRARRPAAQGRAARRPARHGQDAAGARDRRRGARRVLLGVGRGVRRVARRRRRRPHPRPVRARPARPRPRSCSSTSSTPSGASAARASARATTSASRRSTSCWSRWTASTPAAA